MRLDDFEAVHALVRKRQAIAEFVAYASRELARVDEELAGYGVDLAPMPIAAPAVIEPDPLPAETLGEKAARLIEERPVEPAPVWLTDDMREPIMQASGPRLEGEMRYAMMALCAVGGFAVAAWLQTWWVILLIALGLFVVAGILREGSLVRGG